MCNNRRLRKILSNSIGYFCIIVFFSLTTYIVFIFYSNIAPSILEHQDYAKFIFHFIFGNWLAINIYFNYIMAWLTSPGLAKNYQDICIKYPICQKCSFRKPPRTHHCSWCNECILIYDHHCPWLNNCVGFYNHRYFYQFCCFMSIGCLYAGLFGYREYQISILGAQIFHYLDSFAMTGDILDAMGVAGFITYYIFVIALVMGIVLLGLCWWHGRLISHGETSLERLMNQNTTHEDREQGLSSVRNRRIHRIENWKHFLGIRSMSAFIRQILLPSMHKPRGNGITITDDDTDMNSISYRKDSNQHDHSVFYGSYSYTNTISGYLPTKSPSEYTSWLKSPISNNVSSSYQSETSMVDWNSDGRMNEV